MDARIAWVPVELGHATGPVSSDRQFFFWFYVNKDLRHLWQSSQNFVFDPV
jgi:hypothetical protein